MLSKKKSSILLFACLMLGIVLLFSRSVQAGEDPEFTPPTEPEFEAEQQDVASPLDQVGDGSRNRPGSIIVQFDAETSADIRTALNNGTAFDRIPFPQSIAQLNQQMGASDISSIVTRQMAQSDAAIETGVAYIFVLEVEDAKTDYAAVAYAQDNHVTYTELNKVAQTTMTPNDTLWGTLWGMSQIDMPTAWDNAPAAGSGVTVAVIDTGVDYTHPDLDGNMAPSATWWDFVDGDAFPDDLNGHGTHVAGTIAAEGNNSLGVIGVAFNAQIMPLRALDAAGSGVLTDLATAVSLATWNGADVINNSWGMPGRSTTLEAVVNFAHLSGSLVVSAAGNHASNPVHMMDTCHFAPTNIENSMSVGAFDSSDLLAVFSDTGVKIDVTAPGVNINSTEPGGTYTVKSGTSMAAPHVSGLAAVLIQQHPSWTPEQIKQALRISADQTLGTDSDYDPESGFGRIDANAATLFGSTAPADASVTSPYNCQTVTGTVDIVGVASASVANPFTVSYGAGDDPTTWFTIATGTSSISGILGSWNTTGLTEGAYTVRVTTSNGSSVSEDRNIVNVDHYMAAGFPTPVEVNGFSMKAVKSADINGIGDDEIIVGSTVFNSSGMPHPLWDNNPGNGRTNPAIVNIDGDSELEIISAEFDCYLYCPSLPGGGAPIITAYNHNATIDWTFPVNNPATGITHNNGTPSSISAGDVDGDGELEIVFSIYFLYNNSPQDSTVFVLDAATGALELQQTVAGSSFSAVALGDLDNDGVEDMVIETYTGSSSGMIHALHGDGTLVTGWPVVQGSAIGRQDPALGDIDCDGNLNVLVGKRVRDNDGSYTTGWATAPFIARSSGIITPLDDGGLEMEAVLGGGNSAAWWVNEHDATLKYVRTDTTENLNMLVFGFDNYTQGTPISADIDGDGSFDIIRQPEQANTTRLTSKLYGSQSTTSAFPTYIPRQVWDANKKLRGTAAVADIDDDGDSELLLFANRAVHVWDFPSSIDPDNPWPMYQHDLRNSGNVGFQGCPSVDLELDKTATGYFEIGGIGSYLLEVTNVGSSDANPPITITDNLPAGMSYVSAGPAPWSCVPSGSTVTCTYSSILPAGASTTLVLNVAVSGSPMTTENCATLSTTGDVDLSNNFSCVIHDVVNPIAISDLGDAPDSSNHGGGLMTTYWWPSAVARFPTVFDVSTGFPPGPMHVQAEKDAWLGTVVSAEREADLGAVVDQGGVGNIRDPFSNSQNRDRYDDGIHLNTVNLPRCWFTNFKYDANNVGGSGARLMNTWIDYNRDGDFEDRVPCIISWGPWSWTIWVSEWAIQNQPVGLANGFNSNLTSPYFFSARSTGLFGDQGWMRVSLTALGDPAPAAPVPSGSDARGPNNGYQTGETEDYRLRRPWIIVTATPSGVATYSVRQSNGLSGTVTVPAGALSESVEMAYVPTSLYMRGAQGAAYAGIGFEIVAESAERAVDNAPYQFASPIAVEVAYSAENAAAFADGSLTLYERTGMNWQPLSCGTVQNDTDQGKLLVSLCNSGEYAVFGSADRQPPAISVPEQLPPDSDGDLAIPISLQTIGRDYSGARFTIDVGSDYICCDEDCDLAVCIIPSPGVSVTTTAQNGQIHVTMIGAPILPDGHVTVLKLRGGPDRAGSANFAISNVVFTDDNGDVAGEGESGDAVVSEPADLSGCDLQMTLTAVGTFAYNGDGNYEMLVRNDGTAECNGELTLTGSLPDGVTLAELRSPAAWSCQETTGELQAFVCSSTETIAAGTTLTAFTVELMLPAAAGENGWEGDAVTQCVRVSNSAESDTLNNTSCTITSVSPAVPTAANLHTTAATALGNSALLLIAASVMALCSGLLFTQRRQPGK